MRGPFDDPPTQPGCPTAAVMSEHGADLLRFIRRRLRSRPDGEEDAKDVLQETLERWSKNPYPGDVRHAFGYLAGIANNVIADFYERESRDCIDYDSARADLESDLLAGAGTDGFSDSIAMADELVKSIRRLSWPQRAVIFLCKHCGMTREEAARHSGLSLSMVDKHLGTAVALVRRKRHKR
jgi:RNA polymerase sigma factor (sigma-70 family)